MFLSGMRQRNHKSEDPEDVIGRDAVDKSKTTLPLSSKDENDDNISDVTTLNVTIASHFYARMRQQPWIRAGLQFWQRRNCREKTTIVVLLVLLIIAIVQVILYIIPRIEHPFEKYPYLRAMVFNPWRYLQVRYTSQQPSSVRAFQMTKTNAFVIHLERDKQRWKQFQTHNRELLGGISYSAEDTILQVFPAHAWVGDGTSDTTNSQDIALQDEWMKKYPFLRVAVQQGNYGDAACALSHILLWKKYLLSDSGYQEDYIFVLEDDAKVLDPLRSQYVIHAPDTAGMIFLAAPAVKRIQLPWKILPQPLPDSPPIQVIGGHGTWGYIMTKEGARKALEHFAIGYEPIDLSLFSASQLDIFLPIGSQEWPTVSHLNPASSTRRSINAG